MRARIILHIKAGMELTCRDLRHHVWKSSSLTSEMEGHLRLGHQPDASLNSTSGSGQQSKHIPFPVATKIRAGFHDLGNPAGDLCRW